MKLPKQEIIGSASCPHCQTPLAVPSAVIKPINQPPAKEAKGEGARPRPALGPSSSLSVGISSLKPDAAPLSTLLAPKHPLAPSVDTSALENLATLSPRDSLKMGLIESARENQPLAIDELELKEIPSSRSGPSPLGSRNAPIPASFPRDSKGLPAAKIPPSTAPASTSTVVLPQATTSATITANGNATVNGTSGSTLPTADSWSTGPRPLKEVDFKEKLGKTTDPSAQRDPNVIRKKKRRLSRVEKRAKLETEGWDNGLTRSGTSLREKLKRIPWGLAGLGIAALLAALYFGLLPHFRKLTGRDGGRSRVPSSETVAAALGGVDEASLLERQDIASFLPEGNRTLEQFFSARTIGKQLLHVRDPERVEPLMAKYYAREGEPKPIGIKQGLTMDTTVVHKQFLNSEIELADFGRRSIILEKTPQGFKLDWESLVGYCDMSWAALQQERPKTPQIFRVILNQDAHWNKDFTDSTQWRCYRLTDRKGDDYLFGYAKLDSAVNDKILQASLGDKDKTLACVLQLAYPENSTNPKQVEIVNFIETGWAYRPDDYNFQGLAPGLTNSGTAKPGDNATASLPPASALEGPKEVTPAKPVASAGQSRTIEIKNPDLAAAAEAVKPLPSLDPDTPLPGQPKTKSKEDDVKPASTTGLPDYIEQEIQKKPAIPSFLPISQDKD